MSDQGEHSSVRAVLRVAHDLTYVQIITPPIALGSKLPGSCRHKKRQPFGCLFLCLIGEWLSLDGDVAHHVLVAGQYFHNVHAVGKV